MRRLGLLLGLLLAGACTRQGPPPEQLAAAAFAAELTGSELMVAGESYRIAGLERQADGSWQLRAGFRFAGVDLVMPVPVTLRCQPGGPSLLLVEQLRVLGFGPYDAQLLFVDSRWVGLWSGPGTQGGEISGTVVRTVPAATGVAP